jgi:hypothetical protein
MNGWQSVSQTAKDLGVTRQTVCNWINRRELIAFQGVSNGPYRVAVVSVEAMKRRLGLLPMPNPAKQILIRDLTNPDDLYEAKIAPVLAELKASSADEVLRRMAVESKLRVRYAKFPDYYLLYTQKLVGLAEGVV